MRSNGRRSVRDRRLATALACFAVLVVGFVPTLTPAAALEDVSFSKLRYDDVRAPVDDGTSTFAFGGEVRQRYEHTEDPDFGAESAASGGVWLQRYSLFGDLRTGPVRAFLQVQSALARGRPGGPSPVDEDRLAWQNAFVDLDASFVTLRAGRQELSLGSGRLLDVREGPNVRRTFDAVRAYAEIADWRVDALAARPVQVDPGSFDNDPDRDQDLWGVYATGPIWRGNLDAYYLGYRNRQAAYVQGTATEVRHSVGARWWGQHEAWDWNWEALVQTGRFDDGDILAWTLATETGHTWQGASWQPRLALSVNVASGDRDPRDGDLQTFNPLFPRGNYFSEAAVLGPRNFFNVHSVVTIRPSARWSLTADANLFWRLETGDGVYAPNGSVIRNGTETSARFVGSAVSFSSEWSLSARLAMTVIFSHFEPGPLLRDTGPSLDLDFVETTLQYRF